MKSRLRLFWRLFKLRRVNILKWLFLRNGAYFNVFLNNHLYTLRKSSRDFEVIMTTQSEFDLIKHALPVDYDGIIIDAGGYIGSAAIAFNQMFPNATIISIEANTENFQLLEINTRDIPNITCLNKALSITDNEKIELHDRGTGDWGYTIMKNETDNSNLEVVDIVETISLKSIIDLYGDCKMIKLDIEGAERTILDNDLSLKEINLIFVELHDRIVEGCSHSFFSFSKDRLVIKDKGEKYLSIKL